MSIDESLDAFGIRVVPAPQAITGFVAIVLVPDASTIRRSYELTAALMPADAESRLVIGSLPHVTLTQCPVREVPLDRVAGIVHGLGDELRKHTIPLGAVIGFGGGFLFWCVDAESPARAALQLAHELAITLADGVLDAGANAPVVEQTIRLTANDAVLVANARAYGYAFVRDRYLPHVTLGFDPRVAAEARSFEDQRHVMTVERVALARLGRYGRVETIFAL